MKNHLTDPMNSSKYKEVCDCHMNGVWAIVWRYINGISKYHMHTLNNTLTLNQVSIPLRTRINNRFYEVENKTLW